MLASKVNKSIGCSSEFRAKVARSEKGHWLLKRMKHRLLIKIDMSLPILLVNGYSLDALEDSGARTRE